MSYPNNMYLNNLNPIQPAYNQPPMSGYPYIPTQFNGYSASAPMQQPQQTPQITRGLSGRMVANPTEITPQEVSMDGSISLFPQNDYSCIYAKAWNADGTIRTIRYIPEPETTKKEGGIGDVVTTDILSDIMDNLNDIKDMLKQKKTNRNSNQTKQEENNA